MGVSVASAQDICSPVGWGTYGGEITGGGNATPVVVTTYQDLKSQLTSSSAAVIYVKDTIVIPSGGRISIEKSNKTLIGLPNSRIISNDRTTSNSGIFYIKNCKNIIFRNLTLEGPGAYDADGWDLLCIDNATYCWVDHCDFQDGMDGNFDLKSQANNIAITWCRFRYLKEPLAGGSGGTDDHRFTNLIGSSDSNTSDEGKLKITFQFCWWDEGCVERMPRIRFGQVHLVNNLFTSSVGKYCIRAAYKSDVYIDRNAFIGIKNPVTNNRVSNVGQEFYCTYVDNYTSGTSGTDTQDKIYALEGYSGVAKWNPYTTSGYNITPIDGSLVQAAVSNEGCGAGATLTITGNSASDYTISCGPNSEPSISLTSDASTSSQYVPSGTSIENIVYTYGNSATGFEFTYIENEVVVGKPNWINLTYNEKNVIIGGTPVVTENTNLIILINSTDGDNKSDTLSCTIAVGAPFGIPTNISATAAINSINISWDKSTNATGYKVRACGNMESIAIVKEWNFSTWSINASNADNNLILDSDINRFNYKPATSASELTFANGNKITDTEGLLFTQSGGTKLRLGFGSGIIYLNGTSISVGIPCSTGDTIVVEGVAGNATATNRGFSISGANVFTEKTSSNINSSGILTEAGGNGIWAYIATKDTATITTIGGGMNITRILKTGTSSALCNEYTIANEHTVSYTINGLIPETEYSYQVKATRGSEETAYSTVQSITTLASNQIIDASVHPESDTTTILVNNTIETITYAYIGSFNSIAWEGTASSITPPSGITIDTNTEGKVDISGTPTVVGVYGYTITINGINGGNNKTASGIITVTSKSNDATLSNLSISYGTLSPSFNTDSLNYKVTVPNSVSSITITAIKNHNSARVEGSGYKTLNLGNNPFSIIVTAEDGTQRIYVVSITRESATLSNDTTLSSLIVSEGSITPKFNPSTKAYSVNVSYNVDSITINATSSHTNATINGNGRKKINVGSNIFNITVTAENGVSTGTYKITAMRDSTQSSSSDATLKSITVSNSNLSPAFNPDITEYNVDVDYSIDSIIIIASANHAKATVDGDGVKKLAVGENPYIITVTAENGNIKYYIVTVNRSLGTNINTANIAELTIYPNPVYKGETINILSNNTDTDVSFVEIYNLQGVLISKVTSSHRTSISAPQKAGIYILKVRIGTTEKSLKLLVK